MGVCNGTAETAHMDSVFGSDTFTGHVNSFSNIVPNSTAGWVSSSLQLRGVNCTLAAGPHAGLQSLAYAYEALAEGRALAVVAAASDEIYPQTYYNYDTMGFLCQGAEEDDYRIRPEEEKRKVLGEGAGALVLETAPAALERGAPILAEVLGQGMTMDAGGFLAPNLDPDGLRRAMELALERAGVDAGRGRPAGLGAPGEPPGHQGAGGLPEGLRRTLRRPAAGRLHVHHRLHRIGLHPGQPGRGPPGAQGGNGPLAAEDGPGGPGRPDPERRPPADHGRGEQRRRLQLRGGAAQRLDGVAEKGADLLSVPISTAICSNRNGAISGAGDSP